MNVKIKKNGFIIFNKNKIKCAIGKKGIKVKKKEGDKATPKGVFSIGKLYYRSDRIKLGKLKLIKKQIKKNMGWCHNINNKNYNKEVKFKSYRDAEKLYRNDHKYNIFLVINSNNNPIKKGAGSAIFLHLTKNYKKTSGCIAINLKDFKFVIKKINKKTKIIIG